MAAEFEMIQPSAKKHGVDAQVPPKANNNARRISKSKSLCEVLKYGWI
jgi:hypothetical protein